MYFFSKTFRVGFRSSFDPFSWVDRRRTKTQYPNNKQQAITNMVANTIPTMAPMEIPVGVSVFGAADESIADWVGVGAALVLVVLATL
jgi:hypothetical protein